MYLISPVSTSPNLLHLTSDSGTGGGRNNALMAYQVPMYGEYGHIRASCENRDPGKWVVDLGWGPVRTGTQVDGLWIGSVDLQKREPGRWVVDLGLGDLSEPGPR